MQRTTRLLPAKSLHRPQLEPARKRTARNALFFRSERVPWPATSALIASRETLSGGCRRIIDVRHALSKVALIALWINKTTVLCNQ